LLRTDVMCVGNVTPPTHARCDPGAACRGAGRCATRQSVGTRFRPADARLRAGVDADAGHALGRGRRDRVSSGRRFHVAASGNPVFQMSIRRIRLVPVDTWSFDQVSHSAPLAWLESLRVRGVPCSGACLPLQVAQTQRRDRGHMNTGYAPRCTVIRPSRVTVLVDVNDDCLAETWWTTR
jgi:hypothetical protein